MFQVRKNEDGSYTIMPVLKSEADLLDHLYKAYQKWSENECKNFTVADYRDQLYLHKLENKTEL